MLKLVNLQQQQLPEQHAECLKREPFHLSGMKMQLRIQSTTRNHPGAKPKKLQRPEGGKCQLPGKFTAWLLDFQRRWLDEDGGSNRREANGVARAAVVAVLENPDDAAADGDDDDKSGNGRVGGGAVTFHAQLGTPPVPPSAGLLLRSLDALCIMQTTVVYSACLPIYDEFKNKLNS